MYDCDDHHGGGTEQGTKTKEKRRGGKKKQGVTFSSRVSMALIGTIKKRGVFDIYHSERKRMSSSEGSKRQQDTHLLLVTGFGSAGCFLVLIRRSTLRTGGSLRKSNVLSLCFVLFGPRPSVLSFTPVLLLPYLLADASWHRYSHVITELTRFT